MTFYARLLSPAMIAVPELALQYARLFRQVKVQETLFTLLTSQYEQAKIAEARDTPTVQVLDSGVPADKRDDVVTRFVRLDESRSKPGTGLGLSLVEAVMEMHHGSLELGDTAEGQDNPGLTVAMVFPARAA